MQTAVKVSLGPHRQTKDIQHLSCLLTCWCKSRKPVAMSSRGVQTTQRRLNPPRRQMRKERQEKRVFDATLLSDFFICSSLISVWPKESNNEPPGLQETRGKSLSHIEPRLFFFSSGSASFLTKFTVWQFHRGEKKPDVAGSSSRHQMSLLVVLERWKMRKFLLAIRQRLVKERAESFVSS